MSTTAKETGERTPLDAIADALESIATSVTASEISIKNEIVKRMDTVDDRLAKIEERLTAGNL